jgi:mersacidin/lichenicidin family type 2 lantibiotic
MRKKDIIRAWKDEEYRQSLSAADREMLPQHPAGFMELSDEDLGGVAGGTELVDPTWAAGTLACCSWITHACGTSWRAYTYGCCPPPMEENQV